MSYYNARFERQRKEQMTPERIIQIARQKGFFTVSLRWRDDWLAGRCANLKKQGLLKGGRREGRQRIFYPVLSEADDLTARCEKLREALDECATRLHNQILRGSGDQEFADAAVAKFRAALSEGDG